MRQKYLIIQDPAKKKMKIREYAIIEKNLHNTDTSMLRPEDYSFLHEEVYDSPVIKSSISDGMKSLVAALRTPSFFPVEQNAAKIAETVMALYAGRDKTLEVFIDDRERRLKKSGDETEIHLESDDKEQITESMPIAD